MNKMKFTAVFIGFLVACSAKPITGHQNTSANDNRNVDKEVLLQLVNKARSGGCNCGDTWYPKVPVVKWNNQLQEAAQEHSTDMYKKNYFSHNSPTGSNAGDRIQKAGYQWKLYGENIATGQTSEQQVVAGWLKSPGHCKNIMNASFTDIGVGREGNLWTMALANK
jgi:uncharacterized protein YkwD